MANYRKKETFRWTLFQDFDNGAAYDEAEREFQDIYSASRTDKRGNLNIACVDLFPEYNILGERMEGYRARIVVMGEMNKDHQHETLMHFMRLGWHF